MTLTLFLFLRGEKHNSIFWEHSHAQAGTSFISPSHFQVR